MNKNKRKNKIHFIALNYNKYSFTSLNYNT